MRFPEKFFCGFCDAFAIALHRLSGLPLASVCGKVVEEDGDIRYDDHHLVIIEDYQTETFIDAAGRRFGLDPWRRDIGSNCFVDCRTVEILLRPVSIDEALFIFTTTGVSENEVAEAMDCIKESGLLAELGVEMVEVA